MPPTFRTRLALGNSANIPALQDITVQAIDADDYSICFGGKSNSLAQPLFTVNAPTTSLTTALNDATTTTITVADSSRFLTSGSFTPFAIDVDSEEMWVTGVSGTGNTTWTVQRGYNNTVAASHAANASVVAADQTALSGLLPEVTLTAVRTPGTVTIPVSNSPSLTARTLRDAQNIQYAFAHTTSQIVYTAPYTFPPDYSVDSKLPDSAGPYYQPRSVPLALPAVSVTARSTTEFDITFTGDAGYNEQPTLQLLDTSNQQVQQIQVTPQQAVNGVSGVWLVGNLTLTTGKGTTSPVFFDGLYLGSTAAQLKAVLVALGYSPSTTVTASYSNISNVSAPNATVPYTLTITWSSSDTASGVIPLVQGSWAGEYGLMATITASYGDGKPLAGATTRILKESSDAFRVNDPDTVWNPSNANRPQRDNQNSARWRWTPTGLRDHVAELYAQFGERRQRLRHLRAVFLPAGYVNQYQTIQFTPDPTAALSNGTFLLTTGKNPGSPVSIPFYTTDSDPFGALATRVQAALVGLGYDPATKVTAIQQAPPTCCKSPGEATIRRSRSRWSKSPRRWPAACRLAATCPSWPT